MTFTAILWSCYSTIYEVNFFLKKHCFSHALQFHVHRISTEKSFLTIVASWCSCYSSSCVMNFSKLNITFFGIPHRHCILMIHHFSQMFLAFYAYFDVCWISFPMKIFCANIASWSSWYFTTFLKSIFNIFRMFSHLMIVEFDS